MQILFSEIRENDLPEAVAAVKDERGLQQQTEIRGGEGLLEEDCGVYSNSSGGPARRDNINFGGRQQRRGTPAASSSRTGETTTAIA